MMGLQRIFRPGFLLLVGAMALATPATGEGRDPFEFLSEDVPEETLRKRTLEVLSLLSGSPDHAIGDRGVVVCAPGDEADRKRLLHGVHERLDRGAEALRSLGLEPVAARNVRLVFVEAATGFQGALTASPGRILVRTAKEPEGSGRGGRPLPMPTVPTRKDGPITVRDLQDHFQAMARWRQSLRGGRAASGGPASLDWHLALSLVDPATLSEATPPWARMGLLGTVALKCSGASAGGAPSHVPGTVLGGGGAGKWVTETPPPGGWPVAVRAFADFMGVRPGPEGSASLASLLRGDFAAAGLDAEGQKLLLETAAVSVLGDSGSCDETGTMPCSACGGRGRMEITCVDCEGGGAVVCPSCLGTNDCWSGCDRGVHRLEGDINLPCKFCSKGKVSCKACFQKSVLPCASCRGKGYALDPCPNCVEGKVRCVACGPGAGACATCSGHGDLPCRLCARTQTLTRRCATCFGASYAGCKACYGTTRELCGNCDGMGRVVMVYKDGTTASASGCDHCNGAGMYPCRECKGGKIACGACNAKGSVNSRSIPCPDCNDTFKRPCVDCTAPTPRPPVAVGEDEAKVLREVVQKARTFVIGSRDGTGAFALRRKGTEAGAGELQKATLFSNADVLWTLLTSGSSADDPIIAKALLRLRSQVKEALAAKDDYVGVQAISLALRVFLLTGDKQDRATAETLVDVLEKAQKSSGHWDGDIKGKDNEENIFNSLTAAETLYVAQRAGLKVSPVVWNKTYKAGVGAFTSRGPSAAKTADIGAIDVLSNLALIIFAKAGSLKESAATFDYTTIPDVQVGLAWLDRHMDLRDHPRFMKGARVRQDKGGAYFAYLFALQRLAQMLRIDLIGGRPWYTEGVRHVVTLQRGDGSFEETGSGAANWSVRSSTNAILFLLRATPPVTGE